MSTNIPNRPISVLIVSPTTAIEIGEGHPPLPALLTQADLRDRAKALCDALYLACKHGRGRALTRFLGRGSIPRIVRAIEERETVNIYQQKSDPFVANSYGWGAVTQRATIIPNPSSGLVYVLIWWSDARRKNGVGARESVLNVGHVAHARNVIAHEITQHRHTIRRILSATLKESN